MNPLEQTRECIVDGPLKCVEKRELTKRGVRFSQIKLKRANSTYSRKFTVPAIDAAAIEIGGYYKVAVLPDLPRSRLLLCRSSVLVIRFWCGRSGLA